MLLQRLENLLLPPVCIVCDGDAVDSDICTDCADALPWNDICCPHCALPLAEPTLCGGCLNEPPPWVSAYCPLVYGFPVQSLLQQFKFARRLAAGRVLASLCAPRFGTAIASADCLVPVPLHWRRRMRRQFNQASEIARIVGGALRVPVVGACRRVRATGAQSGLNARERKRNLRGAFRVTRPVEDLHVVIVDDILTTGSTAAEMAQALTRHGARRVDVLALARA